MNCESLLVGKSNADKARLVEHHAPLVSHAPFWGIALVLGLIQVWTNRFYMGNDGVPYLDMADAYLRGDWHTALNGFWNPLYAWLIGLDFLIFRPSRYWEYPVVELLNFGIYAATVASFEYFLRGWLASKREDDEDEVAVRVIAYGLFLFSSLILIGVWTVNADMLVAAFFYAALGVLLRAHYAKTASAMTSVILGTTLAAGYYSKAVMFPLSIVLLLIAWRVLRWRRALIAACVFGLLSAPLIAGVSKATGHLTFGDSGRLNYGWYVNGVALRHWEGGPVGVGQPQHPPRMLLDSPGVYEFGSAFPEVTYPLHYDDAYWYQGLRVRIDPRGMAGSMRTNLQWILQHLVLQAGGFLLGWGICFLLYKNKVRILRNLSATWPAWSASLAAVLLYCLVHVETRYIGAFATVLLLTAYTAIRVPGKLLAVSIAVVGLMWAVVGSAGLTLEARTHQGHSTSANVSSQTAKGFQKLGLHAPNVWWQVATGLQEMGLHANDKVASVCWSNRSSVLWARLARAHIVAETDCDVVDFWQLSEVDQRRVLAALARSGASMAVSDETPPDAARAAGWRQVGSTHYYAYSLAQLLEPLQSSAIPAGVGPGNGAKDILLTGTR
jgi:hypothetical protein